MFPTREMFKDFLATMLMKKIWVDRIVDFQIMDEYGVVATVFPNKDIIYQCIEKGRLRLTRSKRSIIKMEHQSGPNRAKAIMALDDARVNGVPDFLFLRGIVETAKLCGLNPEGQYKVDQLGWCRVTSGGSILQ